MNESVRIEIADGVALVTLNRPDKHNALDGDAFAGLAAAGEQLASSPSVRAVVLRGAGESFCSGIDHALLRDVGDAAIDGNLLQPRNAGGANFFQSAAMVWRDLPIPVIAAVRGVAYGAGLQVAAAADVRIATPDSRWSIMEVRWGIIPDMGLSVTLRHVVPADRIRRLAMTGQVIDGEEAYRLGLVTELSEDPVAAARRIAGEIAGKSPDAVRAVKALLNRGFDEPPERALRLEAELQAALIGSPNQVEAVSAGLGRRAPQFTDPDLTTPPS